MPSSRVKCIRGIRRGVRWLLPAALLALAPKCLVCVLAYAGAGAALGLGGPEWCGAEKAGEAMLWTTGLAWAGVALAFFAAAARTVAVCRRTPPSRENR